MCEKNIPFNYIWNTNYINNSGVFYNTIFTTYNTNSDTCIQNNCGQEILGKKRLEAY